MKGIREGDFIFWIKIRSRFVNGNCLRLGMIFLFRFEVGGEGEYELIVFLSVFGRWEGGRIF